MGGPEGVQLLACRTADGQQLRLHLMILAHTDPSEGVQIFICRPYFEYGSGFVLDPDPEVKKRRIKKVEILY